MTIQPTSHMPSTVETLAEIRDSLKAQTRAVVAAGQRGVNVYRIERQIEIDSPLELLRRLRAERKFFWRGGEVEIAAVGVAEQINGSGISDASRMTQRIASRMASCDYDLRYYGGFRFDRFDGARPLSPEWQTIGDAQMFLPILEIVRTSTGSTAAMQLVIDPAGGVPLESQLAMLDGIVEENQTESTFCPPQSKTVSPSHDDWDSAVSQALKAIGEAQLKKVVLARRVSCTLEHSVEVIDLVSRAYGQDRATTTFAMQISPQVGFFGSTPEHLFTRRGRQVLSEALAGTRRYGGDFVNDFRAAVELLTSDKDLREVELVREAIEAAMQPLCEELETYEEPYVHRAGTVQHLRYPIDGILKSEVSDADLLLALSPTPAVCGTPYESAIEQIRKLESFDRGWYAGPVGWISRDAAEFVVAIRSALVHGNTVHLYSGAGIVEGSEASAEWDELDAKIATLKAALGA